MKIASDTRTVNNDIDLKIIHEWIIVENKFFHSIHILTSILRGIVDYFYPFIFRREARKRAICMYLRFTYGPFSPSLLTSDF